MIRLTRYTLILFATIAQTAFAQSADDPRAARIHLLTRADADSVVLRWMPSTAGAWSIANQSGYIVERVRVDGAGAFDRNAFTPLGAMPLKPWPVDAWRTRMSPAHPYVAAAGQMLHDAKLSSDANASMLDRAQALGNRFQIAILAANLDPVAADGLGLRLVDRDVRSGDRFIYRVRSASTSEDVRFDTAIAVVDVARYETPPAPHALEAEARDGSIRVHWSPLPIGYYIGYIIERSDDNGRTYRVLTAAPIASTQLDGQQTVSEPEYLDTTTVNYRRYHYRVRGITHFADRSLTADVSGMSRDLTPPPAPRANKATQIGKRAMRTTWDMPETSGDLSG
ncbi:MAG: fibronectin type III domain-containing protein, partial [bacterium]|nr:fibronectin type III domain-containing protein [Candidatus Kapabacteria bacterium]